MTYNHAGNLSLLPSDFFVRFSGYKFIAKLVLIRARVHPFPSRTRKLSSLLLTILGWRRPGKIGSANTKKHRSSERCFFFIRRVRSGGLLWRRLRTVYGVGEGRLRHHERARSNGAGALEINGSRFSQNFVIH